ncbi:MAG: GNAT family N-acetyltransferase [Candidatus Hodarchaeota archaeon]
MKGDYVIRRAEDIDAKGIHEVLLAAFEEYRDYYSRKGFADTILSEELAKIRLVEMRVYVAVSQQGKVIGTVGWEKVRSGEGHIRGMAVHPEWRGRDGPAAALLLKVEEDARTEGCSILTLDTTEFQHRAHRFYEKHGFKRTGKENDFFGSIVYEFAKEI